MSLMNRTVVPRGTVRVAGSKVFADVRWTSRVSGVWGVVPSSPQPVERRISAVVRTGNTEGNARIRAFRLAGSGGYAAPGLRRVWRMEGVNEACLRHRDA